MNVIKIIKALLDTLKANGWDVTFNKQWFDFREVRNFPLISLFILEESPIEHKGTSYKQELSAHIEGFIDSNNDESIYHLISDIKTALLIPEFPFTISYQGYEINLPEDGASVVSVRIKFKIIYLENMTRSFDDRV